MARRDDTPLPPPRPPTLDLSPYMNALATKKRGWLLWMLVLLSSGLAWGAIARLRYVDKKAQRLVEAARTEAAEHRAARFAAEAEVERLREENARLQKAATEAEKKPESAP